MFPQDNEPKHSAFPKLDLNKDAAVILPKAPDGGAAPKIFNQTFVGVYYTCESAGVLWRLCGLEKLSSNVLKSLKMDAVCVPQSCL